MNNRLRRFSTMALGCLILLTSLSTTASAEDLCLDIDDAGLSMIESDFLDDKTDPDFQFAGASFDQDVTCDYENDVYGDDIIPYTSVSGACNNPTQNTDGSVTYDCVWFGHYWQSDTNGDGTADMNDAKSPIKWRVLSVTNDDLFLISDQLLDAKPFNVANVAVTWEKSTIRSWLNGYDASYNTYATDYSSNSFIDNAFNSAEIASIKTTSVDNSSKQGLYDQNGSTNTNDKIYFLSYQESINDDFGFSTDRNNSDAARRTTATAFAVSNNAYADYHEEYPGCGYWWLRSPGYYLTEHPVVNFDGCASVIHGSGANVDVGVRPVLHISPSSEYIYSAGTICSDGTKNETASPSGDEKISVSGVSLVETETMYVGDKITLTPTITPSDATNRTVRWSSSNDGIASVSDQGVVTGIAEGAATITVSTQDGNHSDTCQITVNAKATDAVAYHNPAWNADGTVTWDCVWFGGYWQNDTNGDGKTDTKDAKEAIKWRILSVSDDDIFMVSDKLLDVQQYYSKRKDVTWEKSNIRSWLNGYGSSSNLSGTNYSSNNFLKNAFTSAEQSAIKTSQLNNDSSQGYYDIDGGNKTTDKIFLLSHKDVVNSDYGFSMNPSSHDNARAAETTAYARANNAYLYSTDAGMENNGWWWLRSPGHALYDAAYVNGYGCATVSSFVNDNGGSVRPAIHISPAASVFSAGTICSNGTVTETAAPNRPSDDDPIQEEDENISVTGISLPAAKTVSIGGNLTLIPTIIPSNATYMSVSWSSSDSSIAVVSDAGVVTGISAGTAIVTVVSKDGNHNATCQITVTGNTFNSTTLTMLPGEVRRLRIRENENYLYGVKWVIASANPKGCVSVKNGIVTAKPIKKGVDQGKAVVNAIYGSDIHEFNITVNNASHENIPIMDGKKKYQLTAPKTLNLQVGTNKNISIGIPANLREGSKQLTATMLDSEICQIGDPTYVANRTKASVSISSLNPGATYIEWSMIDDNGKATKAYTKLLIKKPLTTLSIAEKAADPLQLNVGQGIQLNVSMTEGNTMSGNLSFSVKGKALKVSKSGYIVATAPGEGTVTVKSGKITDKIDIKVSNLDGNILTLNKSFITMSVPKAGAKPKSSKLKISSPKKNPPKVAWEAVGAPMGIDIDQTGTISVNSMANPGCYEIIVSPLESDNAYNSVCCQLIVN